MSGILCQLRKVLERVKLSTEEKNVFVECHQDRDGMDQM